METDPRLSVWIHSDPPQLPHPDRTDFSEEPRFVRLPVSMERSCLLGNRNPQQPGQQGHQRGGYMLSSQPGTDPRQVKSFLDSDRQRRDSGVLVEEPDLLNDTANTFLALSMLQTQTDQTGGGRTGDVDRRNWRSRLNYETKWWSRVLFDHQRRYITDWWSLVYTYISYAEYVTREGIYWRSRLNTRARITCTDDRD